MNLARPSNLGFSLIRILRILFSILVMVRGITMKRFSTLIMSSFDLSTIDSVYYITSQSKYNLRIISVLLIDISSNFIESKGDTMSSKAFDLKISSNKKFMSTFSLTSFEKMPLFEDCLNSLYSKY